MASRILRTLLALLILAIIGAFVPTGVAWLLARGETHANVADVAPADVTIVLGASVRPSGDPSPYLRGRLDLAADLYAAGKTKVLLLSGATSDNYNEPEAMRRYMVNERGIPSEHTVLDLNGSDTYSSCLRAKQVFGVNRAIVVSQRYHLNRSVATCQLAGIDAQGLGDTTVGTDTTTWRYGLVREMGGNAKMLWDFTRQRKPVLGPASDDVSTALAAR